MRPSEQRHLQPAGPEGILERSAPGQDAVRAARRPVEGARPLEVRVAPWPEGPLLRPGQQVTLRWQVQGPAPEAIALTIRAGDSPLLERELEGHKTAWYWEVPDVRTAECVVEIVARGPGGQQARALGDSATILGRPLQARLLSNLDERLEVGQQVELEWEIAGGLPPYASSVFLRTNGDSLPIARDLPDSYAFWTVGNHTTDDARLQVVVRDATGREVSALSPRPLRIRGCAVRVMHPNGRELVRPHQRVPITWESSGPVSSFRLNLLIDGEVAECIARDLPPDAVSFEWLVPYLPTERGHIQVVAHGATDRPVAKDESDGYFCIAKERPIRVTVVSPDGSPTGDQVFRQGERVQVRWRTEGCGVPESFRVDLVTITEEGRQIRPIAAALPGDARSCEWVVTDAPTSDAARVRVRVVGQAGFCDEDDSDFYFRIRP